MSNNSGNEGSHGIQPEPANTNNNNDGARKRPLSYFPEIYTLTTV